MPTYPSDRDREDEPLEDPLPGLRAQLDQAIMAAGEIARMARGYYLALIDEGFNEKQALYLVASNMIGTPGEPPE